MHRSALLLVLALLAPARARALDRFEIQVYTADVDEPGRFGLEAHLNFTPSGVRDPAYPGEVAPHRNGRLTLEPSYGVAEWLELGAYLQLLVAPGGDYRYGGNKLRAKLVLPDELRRALGIPLFLGLNAEIGKVPKAIEQEGWANEFRPIIGWTDGRFLAVVNPIFGYTLTGPDRFEPDFEPCGKLAWNTQRGFSVGVEYYAGLGLVSEGLAPRSAQEHLVFAIFDLAPPKGVERGTWELDLGVGAGLTSATAQRAVLKAIVGRSF
jgi:hypothetical protein